MRSTTYAEVSSGALDFPEKRFDVAANMTHESLRDLHSRRLIVGAMLFGSAIAYDLFMPLEADPLSDLDTLIIVKSNESDEAVSSLHTIADKVFQKTAVATEMS